MSAPLLSVIVPTYNSQATIDRCLQAITKQETAVPYEVIVVDSGTDETAVIAAAVGPGVRVVKLGRQASPPLARHVGTLYARGAILGFVDSDAYVTPDWVQTVYDRITKGADLVCGSIDNAHPSSRVAQAEQFLMHSEFLPIMPTRTVWFAPAGNMAMPRATYDRFGPFPDVPVAEDILFSVRVRQAEVPILFDPGMRIYHDNRTRPAPFLRRLIASGNYTARARHFVAFSDSDSFVLFLCALPLAPIVKVAKVFWRIRPYGRRIRRLFLQCFHWIAAGSVAYSIGLLLGATDVLRIRLGDWGCGTDTALPMSSGEQCPHHEFKLEIP